MKDRINIDELINKATKEAIREYDREKRQEQKRKVFHNTKLLLSHYNDLKSHVVNAIDDINRLHKHELHESDYIDMERSLDELYISSIKKSKTKTLIMIAHIDMALKALEVKQHKLCSLEKYQALKMYYLDEMSYEDIVNHFNCGVNTPRRWMNDMINELSILLFGIEGMKLDMVQA